MQKCTRSKRRAWHTCIYSGQVGGPHDITITMTTMMMMIMMMMMMTTTMTTMTKTTTTRLG